MTHSQTAAVCGASRLAKDGASLTLAGGASPAAPGPLSGSLDGERCRALWLEVINRAILDVVEGTPDWRSVAWFRNGGEDFRMVCWLAGMEPDCVRKRVLAHLDGSNPIKLNTRKSDPAKQPGRDWAAVERQVIAYHDENVACTAAIARAFGVSEYFVSKTLKKCGRAPHRVRSGEAYRARHDEIINAKKKGGKATATIRKRDRAKRMEPLMQMLNDNPGMTVATAALACGIPYSSAKGFVREARKAAPSAAASAETAPQVAGDTDQRTVGLNRQTQRGIPPHARDR